ncbi:hypothetical protein pdam_00019001 [Pocillopora damicornis]|uniref:Uncharacterized protein n=1 Tax=Pocillopora damicornis TaxID=46731 RepID=A0A3M6U266_POCDA|nr:hypothetical protein pdam_00019001 [Pocillopora damicornis]
MAQWCWHQGVIPRRKSTPSIVPSMKATCTTFISAFLQLNKSGCPFKFSSDKGSHWRATTINPLTPKSDQHLISPYNITPESCTKCIHEKLLPHVYLPLESELCLEALAKASSRGGNSPAIPLSQDSILSWNKMTCQQNLEFEDLHSAASQDITARAIHTVTAKCKHDYTESKISPGVFTALILKREVKSNGVRRFDDTKLHKKPAKYNMQQK